MSSEVHEKFIKQLFESQKIELKEDPLNGLVMNGHQIPQEVISKIFCYLEPKVLLKCSEVCHNWNKTIKESTIWKIKYTKKYDKTPKNWPWFVLYLMVTTNYFDQNLVLNGCGEEGTRHWITSSYCGIDYRACLGISGFLTLNSLNVSTNLEQGHELRNTHSCFQAVRVPCSKYQHIDFTKNKLIHSLINAYKPTIYISEWHSSSFPVSSTTYILEINFYKDGKVVSEKHQHQHDIFRYNDTLWRKEAMSIDNYQDVDYIIYKHSVTPAFKHHPFRTINLVSLTAATAKILPDAIPEIQETDLH